MVLCGPDPLDRYTQHACSVPVCVPDHSSKKTVGFATSKFLRSINAGGYAMKTASRRAICRITARALHHVMPYLHIGNRRSPRCGRKANSALMLYVREQEPAGATLEATPAATRQGRAASAAVYLIRAHRALLPAPHPGRASNGDFRLDILSRGNGRPSWPAPLRGLVRSNPSPAATGPVGGTRRLFRRLRLRVGRANAWFCFVAGNARLHGVHRIDRHGVCVRPSHIDRFRAMSVQHDSGFGWSHVIHLNSATSERSAPCRPTTLPPPEESR